jgi:2-polyprenyl-3-methyl-5-hydroxy-6-metoxy-1,4-benzoquinol methylase
MSYNGSLVKYYDKIFSQKKYSNEVKYISDVCKKYLPNKVNNILDFGCGTGTHSILLANDLKTKITGYDLSPDMIRCANEKKFDHNLCYFTSDKNHILNQTDEFDLTISMFYVVNHLVTYEDLNDFLKICSTKTKKDGLLIFDCWNGVAALRDPPYSSTKERFSNDGTKIVTDCYSKTDLLNCNVNMTNNVKVFKNKKIIDSFTYNLEHTLWTPFILKQTLEKNGFETALINKTYDINSQANHKDYKISFVCINRGVK